MSDSPQTEDGSRPEEQQTPLPPHTAYSPSSPRQENPHSKPDDIKEKFLVVAKEKSHLESVVQEQKEMIKRLDEEKTRLSLSLKTLTESYNKMQALLLQENTPGQPKNLSSPPNRAFPFFPAPKAQDEKSDVIKEKFLVVAKEKSRLDAVIMQQHDMIKKLEEENASLSLSLKTFAESHEKMKEKLLDFGILRNMEIAELKQMIDRLMTENKKLVSEKDLLCRNGERDERTSSLSSSEVDDTLWKEKQDLEVRLQKAVEDLKHLEEQRRSGPDHSGDAADLIQANWELNDTVASLKDTIEALQQRITAYEADLENVSSSLAHAEEKVRTLEHDEILLKARLQEAEHEHEETRAELGHVKNELDRLRAEKSLAEDDLVQKVQGYDAEISALKSDIAELTATIEKKMQDIDEAHAKVAHLTEDLSIRERQLHEKIPALLDTLNLLSRSLDEKTEEISFFSSELFDLTTRMTSLNGEIIRQDELLIEITGEYKKQAEQGLLLDERLKQEVEELRTKATVSADMLEKVRQEKQDLEQKIMEADSRIVELGSENTVLAAGIAEKGKTLAALQHELDLFSDRSAEAEKVHAKHLSALQEKIIILNQQLLEKNELLTALSSEHADISEKESMISGLRAELAQYRSGAASSEAEYRKNIALLEEQISILNQQLLEKNELLTALSSEQHHDKEALSSLTESFRSEKAELEEEVGRLRAEVQHREERFAAQLSLIEEAQEEKADLETQVEHATEKIMELSAGQDRLTSLITQKEEALSLAEAETKELQAAVEQMQATIDGFEKKMADEEQKARSSGEEREELLRSSQEYREAFSHLKEEIVSLNQKIAETETTIGVQAAEKVRMLSDIADLQDRLEQSRSAFHSLETLTAEREASAERITAEKNDLLDTIEKTRRDIAHMQQEKDAEIQSLRNDLSAYGKAFADLGIRLEQSMRENEVLRAQSQGHRETSRPIPAPTFEKEELTLSTRVISGKKEKPAPERRTLGYTLLALILIAGLGYVFYAYNTGRYILPFNKAANPVRQAAQETDFPYIDMLSLLTRSAATDVLKFQATLMSEPLVLKSDDPAEASLFDFRNYEYFKVTISSIKEILNKDLAANPYSYIKLSAGTENLSALPEKRMKDIKTFYKKDDPVSVTFYCAFSRNTLHADSLSLSLRQDTGQATLTWDLRALRTYNIIP